MNHIRPLRNALAVSLAIALAFAAAHPAPDAAEPGADEPARAVVIRLEGTIAPMLEQYFYRKLDTARKHDADLLIIEIDSPGGHLDVSLRIAERLRDLAWARTVAYVPREAISGAAIVALGCDDIVMAPEAHIGDAGPIFQGRDFLFQHAPEKLLSYLVPQVRDLAEAKGRPPALVEAMVDRDLVVYQVRNTQTGEEAYMSDKEIDSDEDPGKWEKVQPVFESREDKFLNVNGRRAVELNLAQGIAEGEDELFERYQLAEDPLVLKRSGVDTAVYILNHWFITGLLFVVGLVALYVELSAPGISIGGLLAGLCFTLFFWSRFLGGTSGWLEVLLFAAGLVFLGVELFVLPGFGVAGVLGIFLMLASVVMASQDFIIPNTSSDLQTLGNTLLVIVGSIVTVTFAIIMLSSYLGTIPVLNRLALHPPTAAETPDQVGGKPKPAIQAPGAPSGFAVSVGDWGVAESPLRPAGKAVFGDQYVDVLTDGSFVEKGKQVRIIEVSGNRIVVREVDETA